MGLFSREKPVTAAVAGKALQCLVCSGTQFWNREVKLNTSGAELMGMEWANESATGLECTTCGFIHEFTGNAIQLYRTE